MPRPGTTAAPFTWFIIVRVYELRVRVHTHRALHVTPRARSSDLRTFSENVQHFAATGLPGLPWVKFTRFFTNDFT